MQKADKEWGTRESGEDGKRRRREGESLVPLPVVAHRPEADEFSQKKKSITYILDAINCTRVTCLEVLSTLFNTGG